MKGPALPLAHARALLAAVPFDVEVVRERPEAERGGYEIIHASPGLEIGVYVLVGPEPDQQQPHEDDAVYVVPDGRGVLKWKEIPLLWNAGRPSTCRRALVTASRPTSS